MDFLEGYVSGDLPAGISAQFEQHLTTCRSCAAYTASYQATIRLARHLHDCDEAEADMPNELLRAILAARAQKYP